MNEQEKLLARAERMQAEARALTEINRRISSSLDLSEVLHTVVESTRSLVGSDLAYIALLKDDGSLLVEAIVGNRKERFALHSTRSGRGISGQVLATGHPYQTENFFEDTSFVHHPESTAMAREEGVVSVLTVPIRLGERSIGILWVASRSRRRFSEDEVTLLEHLGAQAAVAIENARIHAAHLAAEQEANRHAQEVAALLKAAEHLNGTDDPSDVLLRIIEVMAEALAVTRVNVATKEGDAGLRRYIWREGTWRSTADRLPRESITGQVMEHGQTFRSDDMSSHPLMHRALLTGPDHSSMLMVPLKGANGRVLGTVSLHDRRDGLPFSEDDQRLAEGIAHHAAVALQRATLITELRQSEERYRELVEGAHDIVYAIDRNGRFTAVNAAAERIIGYTREELLGMSIYDLIAPEYRAAAEVQHTQALASGASSQAQIEIATRSGHHIPFEISVRALERNGVVVGIHGVARDISVRRTLEQHLLRQAFYDTLTELPNRALFMDRLRHALETSKRRGSLCAVLFLDLDGFKVINDTLGHDVGDDCLVAVAKRLQSRARSSDTVARFGGDEFAILLEGIADAQDAVRVGEDVLTELRKPIILKRRSRFISATIGVAVSSRRDTGKPDRLLHRADIALYRAKAGGKSRVLLFDQGMREQTAGRLRLEADLRGAFDRRELRLYYQPILDLQSGRVSQFEALLRWEHPRQGLILPESFIPMAEESGLILPIGRWVLQEACRQASAWRAMQPDEPPLIVTVNLSALQFQQPDLVEQIASILSEAELLASCLCIEITESAAMQDGRATIATLHALKVLGVSLSIDDFGTGYSSLSYLRRFPIDSVKIDQSFVAELGQVAEADMIVETMTTLAHALGAEVTAEGIETAAQLERARELHCDSGQGFYFCRPAPAEALETIIRTRRCPAPEALALP